MDVAERRLEIEEIKEKLELSPLMRMAFEDLLVHGACFIVPKYRAVLSAPTMFMNHDEHCYEQRFQDRVIKIPEKDVLHLRRCDFSGWA